MTEFFQFVTQPIKRITSRLSSLDIELTERCNSDCIHCCINLPANDRVAKAREMTTGQVKSILTEAATLGCLRVRFTGGEPLLRPDFEGLYLFARRLGLKVLIFTNARLITPQLADLLMRIPPLVFMEITVYGCTRNRMRRFLAFLVRLRSSGAVWICFWNARSLLSLRAHFCHPTKPRWKNLKHGQTQFPGWIRAPVIPCSSICAIAGTMRQRTL